MSYQHLFEKLASGALILTANARLARRLINTWVETQKGVVAKPKIYSWQEYLFNFYEDLSWPKILKPGEAHWIWREIIKTSSHSLGLIQPEATAKTAHRAYEILLDWCLNFSDPLVLQGFPESPEFSCFLSWAENFEDKTKKINAVTQARALSLISEHENFIPEEKEIILLGFESFSPRFTKILKTWELKNYKIEKFEFIIKARAQKLACINREKEWESLAKLAKFYADKNLNIAVVIPEIVSFRSEVLAAFLKFFEPDLINTPHPIPTKFSITGGEPLASVPIIWEGLLVLENLSKLKDSQGVLEINLLTDWRVFFLGILKQAKWPGEFTLSSFEHQAVMKFYEQLEAWLSMGFLLEDCDIKQAYESLRIWMEAVFFQPKSEDENRVSIYGPLEIAGLIHDVLLVANMNLSSFPGQASPNPYLPYEMQKKYQMPHATPTRELEFASAELQEWLGLSDELIATYALSDGNLNLTPSPLIKEFKNFENMEAHDFIFQGEIIQKNSVSMEGLADFSGPVLSDLERSSLKSGVNIFQSIAACPFQAFAKHRLKIKAIDKPIEPLNLQARGILTHRILEKLMPKIFAENKLNFDSNTPPDLINNLILEAVSEGLEYLRKIQPAAMPYYLKNLEQERLINLMDAWINLEKTREPFELLAQEREVFGIISGISIRARIDRMDQVGNLKIIIDYKTGKSSLNACLGDRPDEPQLGLYALMTNADRIVYATVNIQNLDLEGLDINIEDYKNLWKKSFENLAQEFISGYALVNPKYGDMTCSRCDFIRLCRRHSQSNSVDYLL